MSNDTITLSGGSASTSYYYNTGAVSGSVGTISIGGLNYINGGSVTSQTINTSQITISFPEEWVNCLPDFDRIQKMCKEYPGLAIAFEKFKTTYKLVKDDYDTPKDKRLKP